jgi:hypothetical protein
MEGLLTPVSTSYRSAAKPIEEPLYVYLHFTASHRGDTLRELTPPPIISLTQLRRKLSDYKS